MIFAKLYLAFFKIGLFGFGGGLAIIQLIYDSIKPFADMTPEQFANIVAIAQVTPGPVAVNTATYVGFHVGGYIGAFIATLGVATPAFIIIAVVAGAVSKYKKSIAVNGALEGIRPAAVGLIAGAMLTIGKTVVITDKPIGGRLEILGILKPFTSVINIDVAGIVLCAITILMIQKFKIKPLITLIIIGCAGAILGV